MNSTDMNLNSINQVESYNASELQLLDGNWSDFESNLTTDCIQNNSSACSWNQTLFDGAFDSGQAKKFYWALVLIPLPLVAVIGNILVILSVYKERNLQSATNYFIVSLAFADLLVAAVVMPFAVYVLVNVNWELSDTLCDFYIALDVTCSTASIFNLVAISVDRFIAVTQPIKYSKHKNSKRIHLTIAFVWLVSAAIGSPIVLGLNTSPERQPNLCVFYNSDFIIYSSLSSFYIPCILMIYLYYKIFRAIFERARKAIGKGVVIENTARVQQDGKVNPTTPKTSIAYIKTLSPLIEGDEASHMCPSDNIDELEDEEESPTGDCQVIANMAVSNMAPASHQKTPGGRIPTFKVNGLSMGDKDLSIQIAANDKKNLFSLGKQSKGKKKKREKTAIRRERKATKTLAIVLGVFLFCWVPFFTCNILDAICIKLEIDTWRPGVTVFLLTTWLGYINSCVNPVIYTIFNLEFRKAFKKLLLEPCK